MSYIGIEFGGTKVNIASGTGPNDLSQVCRIPTTSPMETLAAVNREIRSLMKNGSMPRAIGIASFGPIAVSRSDKRYGSFLRTPKAGWSQFDLMHAVKSAFPNMPVFLDTDVNAAALAEGRWGHSQNFDDFAYITIGTGVGVGVISNGRPIHGLLHPEAGHICVKRRFDDTEFKGCCPFHGDCLEGLISGPAIAARTGIAAEWLEEDHPVWDTVAEYLSQLVCNLTLITSPRRIIIGGGVGLNPVVVQKSRIQLKRLLAGYLEAFDDASSLSSYLVPAKLAESSGVLGAICVATSGVSINPEAQW